MEVTTRLYTADELRRMPGDEPWEFAVPGLGIPVADIFP